MADTTNFAWPRPTVGGSSGSWGTILNDTLQEIDTDVDAVKDTADAALPKAGGTMTGTVKVLTETQTVVAQGATLNGTVTLNLSTGNVFHGTVTGNATIAFSNIPTTGTGIFVVLDLTNGGSYTLSWPSGTKWPGGSVPTFTASGRDVFVLFTRDAGTTWSAVQAGAGFA